MNKKYFETKTGSIEEKITQIATEQQSIKKQEVNVKLERKTYFENKPGSLGDVAAKVISENKLAASKEFEKDLVAEKPLSTTGATRKPTSKSDKLYLNNPKEFRRRNELENAYKQILNTMSDKEKNSKEGKIKAMDLARVRSAKSKEDLAKNMKHKGTLKIAEADLDPVNKNAVKKDFKDRQDKDIDNDGDTDSTDKYLHKKRQAISKNIKEKKVECTKCEGKGCSHCNDKGYHIVEVKNAYAVGMAQAMKSKNDKPPLEKSTITKAHDIAKSIMKKEQICPKCGKDHANKINASNCMGESKKTFSDLRTETKVIKLGDKGKTATGKEAGAVDVEPRAIPV